MHAILPSDKTTLTITELPVPSPLQGEVLIKVAAAGVNRADIFQAEGIYPAPEGTSPVLGLEVAGTIAAVGEAVKGYQVGDKVCALLAGGGYAEYAVAPAAHILPVPIGFSFIEAAALPEALFTVWLALYEKARLRAGETVLIHAGASGIGATAIQLATALGNRVFATAGSEEKCLACEKLGAERAFNYYTQDVVSEIKQHTVGKGVNVILDVLGGDYFSKNISMLAYSGRLVNIALLRGKTAEFNGAALLMKNLSIMGMTLRSQSQEQKKHIADLLLDQVWPLLEKKVLKPIIDHTFPLAEAQAAHLYMKNNQHIGKIVLTLD